MSKLYAHLGTILAMLGAGGADFGAFHVPAAVGPTLTAVAGGLVACHIVTQADASSILGVLRHLLSVPTSPAPPPAATPAAPVPVAVGAPNLGTLTTPPGPAAG